MTFTICFFVKETLTLVNPNKDKCETWSELLQIGGLHGKGILLFACETASYGWKFTPLGEKIFTILNACVQVISASALWVYVLRALWDIWSHTSPVMRIECQAIRVSLWFYRPCMSAGIRNVINRGSVVLYVCDMFKMFAVVHMGSIVYT